MRKNKAGIGLRIKSFFYSEYVPSPLKREIEANAKNLDNKNISLEMDWVSFCLGEQ